MSIIKSAGKKIIDKSFEVVKEGAKEIAEIATPEKVIEQLTGHTSQPKSEVTEYLKKLDTNLSPEEIAKMNEKEAKELAETRKMLHAAVPEHMKLSPKEKEPRPYELTVQEEERKKALAVEAQKKQQAQVPVIMGKQRGILGKRIRPKTADIERRLNVKAG